MPFFPALTTNSTSVTPTSAASATTNSRAGVVTIGASSFGTALVSGRKRVPRPAAGMSALWTRGLVMPARVAGGQNCGVGRDERVAAEKARLRNELLAARAARSVPDLEWARAAVRGHVLDRAAGGERVAAYRPLRTEPGSVELLAELDARGVTVLVPVLLADRDLDWARWTPAGEAERLGVDAIRAAGLVVVPALAVAEDGTRLGRGGGSYDR